ncbi:ABC transporter ATP-binding protein [Adhaeribacter sp. BT258]|uniref:ABC transporter ATP-binding protein n=1 Tax=Adhaeribacter terrigena TaxID=2793070 RepID=A0ABS1C0Z5_9BACT|nr:ABC transporter ATP-binding protein [Adhaeribacter terrigena]MBK0402273.1 ABC transporter ATP-binding protein [Adhaeribacter terrigena]
MANVLEIQGLSKNYGSVAALQNVSFSVPQGSIYGLLGPNGSGKTTTLGIVLDVLNASSGSFQWFSQPYSGASKRRIGAILETPNFYPYLSAYKNLQIVADIKKADHAEIEKVLDVTGLLQRRNSPFKSFSLGMKQRLALAASLLGNPEVLVLDEPTNGLDPQGIADVRELIRKIASEGKTIIIASHLLDEVEKVCTHVAVLQKGILKAAGPVSEILAQQDQVLVSVAQTENALSLLKTLPFVENIIPEREWLKLTLKQGFSSADVNRSLFENNIIASQLVVRKKSLESQFLEIVNK